jgi:hypothetical protein
MALALSGCDGARCESIQHATRCSHSGFPGRPAFWATRAKNADVRQESDEGTGGTRGAVCAARTWRPIRERELASTSHHTQSVLPTSDPFTNEYATARRAAALS